MNNQVTILKRVSGSSRFQNDMLLETCMSRFHAQIGNFEQEDYETVIFPIKHLLPLDFRRKPKYCILHKLAAQRPRYNRSGHIHMGNMLQMKIVHSRCTRPLYPTMPSSATMRGVSGRLCLLPATRRRTSTTIITNSMLTTSTAAASLSPMFTLGMVNVDVSPSVILGVGLIGAGVSLWQIRQVKPWISKDYDVVVSCVSLLVGGILIFQGWRLDPLLLFGQLMTTGAALSFAVEALRLRSELYENEEKAALQNTYNGGPPPSSSPKGGFQLPAADSNEWQQQQQQQQDNNSSDFYRQQQQPAYYYSAAGGEQQQQRQQGDDGGYVEADYYYPSEDGVYEDDNDIDSQGPTELRFPDAGGDGRRQPALYDEDW